MKKACALYCVLILLCTSFSVSAYQATPASERTELPSVFNWRDINGTDYTTPIKDQSPAPTCEAFGLCAALETKMQYQLGELYNPDLSENHLYFYAGGTIAQGYVNLMDAANYLMEHGVPDEGCYPDPHRPFDYSFESLPGWENRTVKITEWGWVAHDVYSIKQALIDHGPLTICIRFWQDFFYYFGGIYKHHDKDPVAGHVVTIVGYDDSQECWIVKNSWGTKWGEDGYFRMAYDADMFATWYGPDTGIMYVEGVYGNLKPDVPKIYLEAPDYFHTYLFGVGIPTLLKKLPYQRAAARIAGKLTVTVQTQNTNSVEFFIDDVSHYTDSEAPFSWELNAPRGLHILMVKAYNDNNASIDIQDIIIFL